METCPLKSVHNESKALLAKTNWLKEGGGHDDGGVGGDDMHEQPVVQDEGGVQPEKDEVRLTC